MTTAIVFRNSTGYLFRLKVVDALALQDSAASSSSTTERGVVRVKREIKATPTGVIISDAVRVIRSVPAERYPVRAPDQKT